MGISPQPQPDSPQHNVYKIRIKGHLDSQWSDWFEGLTISLQDNGETLLTGPVIDQAALHGLLKKIRDLGLTLISICPGRPENLDSSKLKKE
ncbi:hypothetical protein EG832_13155 [bacterium]|nr:hypothetical protein [bacterium]